MVLAEIRVYVFLEQNVHHPMEQENGENVEPVLLQQDGPVAALVEDLALDQPNVIQNNNELAIDAIAVDQQVIPILLLLKQCQYICYKNNYIYGIHR